MNRRLILAAILFLIAVPSASWGEPGTITTIAGNGLSGSSGDGGPATQAKLLGPSGMDFGSDGSLYIADTFNNRIRKVSPDGVMTRVAGTQQGFSGDGGPATSAALSRPWDVAVDPSGVIYIADTENDAIRKIAADGTISTIAGRPTVSSGCEKSGIPAVRACLDNPSGIERAADGSLIVADTFNHRVVKIGSDGVLTVLAGNPYGRGFWGDGGPASKAWLADPSAVAVDGPSILVADTGNHRVRRIGGDGRIATVAGNGNGYADEHPIEWYESGMMLGGKQEGKKATEAAVISPTGVFAFEGSIFISSGNQHRVFKIDAHGNMTTIAGKGFCGLGSLPNVGQPNGLVGDGGPATQACLVLPRALQIDANRNLLIADDGNSRIRRVEGPF